MDVPLRPLNCRTDYKIKPFLGLVPHGTTSILSQSSKWQKHGTVACVSYQITASSDFSRRRQRKFSTPRPKEPRGFMPRKQVHTREQRRSQKNVEEKESPNASPSKGFARSNRKIGAELKITTNDEEFVNSTQVKEADKESKDESNSGLKEVLSYTEPSLDAKISQFSKNGEIDTVYEDVMESTESEITSERVFEGKVTTNDEENESPDASPSKEFEVSNRKIGAELKIITNDEEFVNSTQVKEADEESKDESNSGLKEVVSYTEPSFDAKISQFSENGEIDTVYEDVMESTGSEITSERVFEGKVTTNDEENESPDASPSKEFERSNRKIGAKLKITTNDEEFVNSTQVKETDEESNSGLKEVLSYTEPSLDAKISQFFENGEIDTVCEDVTESTESEITSERVFEEKVTTNGYGGVVEDGTVIEDKQNRIINGDKSVEEKECKEGTTISDPGRIAADKIDSGTKEIGMVKNNDVKRVESFKISENLVPKPESIEEVQILVGEEKGDEDYSSKLKLKEDANLHWLAEDNFREGNKSFYYPEVVKPDQDLEVFLNRSFSTLKNEPDVMIMGAFNDWKWKSFTIKLSKSHLNRDWWSCHIHVPKEAYKIDFVFFNGQDVYENNERKDFCINVEGGMDVLDFENILLEEKRREQDELARQQAEMKRQQEAQKNIEADKANQEADRVQAKEEAAKRRRILGELLKKAKKSVDNVWYIEPSEFKCEDKVKLYYNRISGTLVHAKDVWIHGGLNNWKDGLSIASKLIRSQKKDGDWWYSNVVVPKGALVLDWVFADGPPQRAIVYDNNNLQDFHAVVPKSTPTELYWVEEEQKIYRKLQEERRLKEETARAKVEKTASMKALTKERTLRTFLLSQKHIVYTDPLDIQAGKTVTVFYNPANTVLNGKPEIWLRCSFNRWTHRMGPLPPQKMLPSENGSHLKANVKVLLDAYMMDFVFSEKEDGGVFDNKNGMDYHLPVFGGIVKEPPMHIVHIAVEMAPIAKVGGLGDVVTSLSRAVQDLNQNVDIILPKYDCLKFNSVKDFQFHKSYSWGGTEIKVWFGKVEGLSVYFLEPQNGFFSVGCIYGRGNDEERFDFFCHAALEFLLQSGFHPDIIHCHDWSSAPVAWLYKEHYRHYGLNKARVVFTIHNLEFGANLIGKAMLNSDKATTVSPTYSQEVSGNPVIAPHLSKFHGILNGIDQDMWDPYNDKFIPLPYTSENVIEGKRAAKEALQQRLGLKKSDQPLVGIITRLTQQKGIHLIKHAIWRTLDCNGQVVLLGSAPDPRIQNDFVNLANQLHSSHNDRARLCLTYDEPLSHMIYAGANFILVPSIFEPCGLTQLVATRYGSIPIVRKTGGLYDTVFDVDHDKERAQAYGLEPNGFNFDGADAAGVEYALNRAIAAWNNGREWFNSLCKRVMEQDWSWNRPALDYLELYRAARK